MLRVAFPLLALILLTAASGPTILAKKDLTLAQIKADDATCAAEAESARKAAAPSGGLDAMIAADDACWTRLGYAQIPISADESKAFRKLKPDARMQYVVDFSAKHYAPAAPAP